MATYYVDGAVGNNSNAGTSPGAGNAWLTIGKATSTMADGDLTHVKASATYSISAAISWAAGTSNFTGRTQIIGYTTTPGDGGFATVQATAGSFTMFNLDKSGAFMRNFVVDGNSQTSIRGVDMSVTYGGVSDLIITNCNNGALVTYLNTHAQRVWCKSNTTNPAFNLSSGGYLHSCAATGNTATGFGWASSGHGTMINCIAANNTGGSSDGMQLWYDVQTRNCVFWGNGRDGIRIDSNYAGIQPGFANCAIGLNGGYGLNFSTAPIGAALTATIPEIDHNAFGSGSQANTSGARNNYTAGASDVSVTADPFANYAGLGSATTLAGVFACFLPNSTAGGGAAIRGVGYPLYTDVAASQHQDTGGGASTTPVGTVRILQNIGTY